MVLVYNYKYRCDDMVTPENKEYYVVCTRCEHKFSTDKNPKADKEKDKPMCAECKSRAYITEYKEWKKLNEDIFPDITKKLEEIMQSVMISQKKIDLIMAGFQMNLSYQNPDGLFNFLTTVGVDARKAKVTCDMFFGAQQLVEKQTQKILGGTPAKPSQVIMVDQTGKPQVIQTPQPTPGSPSQPPIIFLPSQQPQQQQIDGNKIIQRPIVINGEVRTDNEGKPLMETIIPAGMQQQDPVTRTIETLKGFGINVGKSDEVTELKKMFIDTINKMTNKAEEKSNTDRIIEAFKATQKESGGDSDAVRALKEEMNQLRNELRETKEDKKFQALEAKFDRRLAEVKKDHEGTKLSDEQFQIRTQEKSIGHLTEFAKELGKVVAEESGKIMGPMLEMQRTQFNAQMITQLQAMEVQTKQPPGTYTKILSPPGTVVPQKSGALSKTMEKIKERSG